MMLHVGISAARDAERAAHETIGEARRHARAGAFALVLCTDGYDVDALAAAITRELGEIPWAGCCGAGVFAGVEMIEQGVVVGVLDGADASFGVGVGGPVSANARDAGREAVAEALASLRGGREPAAGLSAENGEGRPPTGERPRRAHRSFIVLSDALTGDAASVIRGAVQEAGAGAGWAGGGAGDNLRYVRTAQFARGRAWHDRVVVVAIDSDRPTSVGIRHGWHPYGPPTMVTRAHGATAVELDYQRAFDAYREVARNNGDDVTERDFARFAMTHPLGIPQPNGEFVIRDPLAVEADGSLRCVAEIPDGSTMRVMQGDRDDLLGAARSAASDARERMLGPPGGVIVFDCVSRYLILGRDMRRELAAIQEGVGRETPMMGCLTLGELGTAGSMAPQFHNKTAVVMALPPSRGMG
jgi:hypothetical protein